MSAAHLGDLAVGQKQQVQISAVPNSTVAEGMHQFKLRVSSDNFTTTDIPITLAVTQSGIGNALIKVSDIYTATLDRMFPTQIPIIFTNINRLSHFIRK